jgi:uncharacterized protein YciI
MCKSGLDSVPGLPVIPNTLFVCSSMKLFLQAFLLCFVISAQAQLTFVFLNKKVDAAELTKEQSEKIMEGHMANMNRLVKEKKLMAAGPFDESGGIFIFKSNLKEEVEGWLSSDPGVQAKRWNIEILSYTPRYNSVCPVSEPYEMISCHFVRYISNLTKYNIQDAPSTFKNHDDYLKKIIQTGNVITEGTFGDREGGILILKGDLQREVIEKDPSINEGLFEIQFKNLWIAKGSFCEK